jgi:hypothetical protein
VEKGYASWKRGSDNAFLGGGTKLSAEQIAIALEAKLKSASQTT